MFSLGSFPPCTGCLQVCHAPRGMPITCRGLRVPRVPRLLRYNAYGSDVLGAVSPAPSQVRQRYRVSRRFHPGPLWMAVQAGRSHSVSPPVLASCFSSCFTFRFQRSRARFMSANLLIQEFT